VRAAKNVVGDDFSTDRIFYASRTASALPSYKTRRGKL